VDRHQGDVDRGGRRVAIGVILGTVMGLLLGSFPLAGRVLEPFGRRRQRHPQDRPSHRSFLLFFGIGPWSKINIAVTGVSFVVFYNVYLGLRLRERETRRDRPGDGRPPPPRPRLRHDPHPRRPFFAALKTGGPLAILGVIGGEFIASFRRRRPRTLHLGHEPRRRDRVRRPDRPGGDDPDPERPC